MDAEPSRLCECQPNGLQIHGPIMKGHIGTVLDQDSWWHWHLYMVQSFPCSLIVQENSQTWPGKTIGSDQVRWPAQCRRRPASARLDYQLVSSLMDQVVVSWQLSLEKSQLQVTSCIRFSIIASRPVWCNVTCGAGVYADCSAPICAMLALLFPQLGTGQGHREANE